jgi:tetratricopeptide (TPR) repeat protein
MIVTVIRSCQFAAVPVDAIAVIRTPLTHTNRELGHFVELTELKQNNRVGNAISCLIKLQLAIDERAKPANKRKREFLLLLQHSPLDHSKCRHNLNWLFTVWEAKAPQAKQVTKPSTSLLDLAVVPVDAKTLKPLQSELLALVASLFPQELYEYTQDRIKFLAPILPALRGISLNPSCDSSTLVLSLIRFWIANGKLDEANDLLGLSERSLTERSPELDLVIADRQYYLGLIYLQREDFATAEVLLNKSRVIRQKLLGNYHSNVADCIYALGTLYVATQAYNKAATCFRATIAIREKLQQHLAIANSMNGLADVFANNQYSKCDLHEAARLYEQSTHLVIAHTSHHPFLASSKIGRADIWARQGEYKLAEELYLEAIAILEVLFGKEHVELAKPKAGLAAVYLRSGKQEQGRLLYEAAIELLRNTFGENHAAITLYKADLSVTLLPLAVGGESGSF